MNNKYPISSYNKYVSLKVNLTMVIIFIIMLKPFLVTLFSLVNRSDRFQLINMLYPDRSLMSLSAFAGIPVAMLMYAWVKREPGASPFVKRLWKNGRKLITATSLLNLVIFITYLLLNKKVNALTSESVQVLIYLAVIFIVYKSQYIKDCFSDFPEKEN